MARSAEGRGERCIDHDELRDLAAQLGDGLVALRLVLEEVAGDVVLVVLQLLVLRSQVGVFLLQFDDFAFEFLTRLLTRVVLRSPRDEGHAQRRNGGGRGDEGLTTYGCWAGLLRRNFDAALAAAMELLFDEPMDEPDEGTAAAAAAAAALELLTWALPDKADEVDECTGFARNRARIS